MSRRVTLEALEFDKTVSALAFSEDEDESAEKRTKIRNIMATVSIRANRWGILSPCFRIRI